jgi:hypothetical protein
MRQLNRKRNITRAAKWNVFSDFHRNVFIFMVTSVCGLGLKSTKKHVGM